MLKKTNKQKKTRCHVQITSKLVDINHYEIIEDQFDNKKYVNHLNCRLLTKSATQSYFTRQTQHHGPQNPAPHSTVPYRTASHRTVPYSIVPYPVIYPFLPYRTVPHRTVQYRTLPCRILPYPTLIYKNRCPTRNLSYLNRSYRINTSCPILLHTAHKLSYRYPTIHFLNLSYRIITLPYPTLRYATLPYPTNPILL